MKFSTMGRHFREGTRNVMRNGWMSFASTSAIAISLFILGVFLLLALNVNYLANQIESEVEIQVFLDEVTPQQVADLQKALNANPQIRNATYIPKDEGLKKLRETLGQENRAILDGLDNENPLPDSFTVEVVEPTAVTQVAEQILELNRGKNPQPISKVDYGHGTVETLFKITKLVRNIGLVLVAGLAFTAMFLIANTIKITIIARRREISIMKLVGATNAFIRWPFFIEGALLGLIGSIIPIGVLLYGYWQLFQASQLNLSMMLIKLLPPEQVLLQVGGLLLSIGIVIGVWGSIITVRKFLKV
ncbi:permease-like cell division protein FtsX [Paenibacillus sp. y28]|uniref:permease-like cell division protein FtsX n=1 Tax=Paenibacillus sp. y28 TaxID=3129110 RepID=UPI003015A680